MKEYKKKKCKSVFIISRDKDEFFMKKGANFGKKKSETLMTSFQMDDPYRPNSSKSFRLRGSTGGISTKSFTTNSILNDEQTLPSNKTVNLATQAIASGQKAVSINQDPTSRALALKKQNEKLKKMIGEDKLSFQDGMSTKSNIHLNPIKNPPPKPNMKIKTKKEKDI